MPSDINEAQKMYDLFTSVGASSFVVTKTDVEQALIWGKSYSAAELREKLPAMVRTAENRNPHRLASGEVVMAGENLIVRPSGADIVFVQLDDLSANQLERLRPASFIMHATSPGNHQAWLAVSDVAVRDGKDFIRRVRQAAGQVDKSASGATRVAGTEVWKLKNLPEPPMVKIIHAIPGRVMTPARLQELGLLAMAEPPRASATDINVGHNAPARVSGGSYVRPWPSYEISLIRAPRKSDGSPDRSKADFGFALTCLTGDKPVEDTIVKLMEVSENAQLRAARGDTGYARITVENAAAMVERNYGRGRNRA